MDLYCICVKIRLTNNLSDTWRLLHIFNSMFLLVMWEQWLWDDATDLCSIWWNIPSFTFCPSFEASYSRTVQEVASTECDNSSQSTRSFNLVWPELLIYQYLLQQRSFRISAALHLAVLAVNHPALSENRGRKASLSEKKPSRTPCLLLFIVAYISSPFKPLNWNSSMFQWHFP